MSYSGGWFGLVVAALVTSTKLSYIELGFISTGIGDHLDRSTTPVFPRLLKPAQPSHPSVGRCNEYCDGSRLRWGRNGEFCVAFGPVIRSAGIVAYCIRTSLLAAAAAANSSSSSILNAMSTGPAHLVLIS